MNCPICDGDIEFLLMYQKVPKVFKYYGEGSSEFEEELHPEEELVFSCPLCGNFVTDEMEKADEILQQYD